MITKAERAFLVGHLEDIAENVADTPVSCGVKCRALEKLDFLLEVARHGKLKNPPLPKPRKMSREELDIWKGAAAISGKDWKKLYKDAQAKARKIPGFPSKDKILVD